MTIAQLIQRQVSLGNVVTFILKTGQEITGTLIEMSRDHVVVEQEDGTATILIDTIGSWKVKPLPVTLEEISPVKAEIQETVATPTDTSILNHTNDEQFRHTLIEIKIRFNSHISALKPLELVSSNFQIPEDELRSWRKSGTDTIWNSAKNKYEYAVKINELSGKFGRIQPVIAQLKMIAARYPHSLSVKRQVTYLAYLSGNISESVALYEEIAIASKQAEDWRNFASIAIQKKQLEQAHIALHQVFLVSQPSEQIQEWYWYVHLVLELGVQSQLVELLRTRENLSEPDYKLIQDATVYILLVKDRDRDAIIVLQKATSLVEWNQTPEVQSLFMSDLPIEYQSLIERVVPPLPKPTPVQVDLDANVQKGVVVRHWLDSGRSYGFLRGNDGTSFYFDRLGVSDDELLRQLKLGKTGMLVTFDPKDGPKGPIAVSISLQRTIDQMFALAKQYASDGEYPKAIAQIRRLLSLSPDYPDAQKIYETWRSYARITGVPQGSNPYAKAKRIQLIEKDLPRAIELFKRAIKEGDNTESAVKDLAAVYVQFGQPDNAISVLNEYRARVQDPQSVDNLLIGFYQRAEQYDKAIDLLEKQLTSAKTTDKKSHFLGQIGTCYLRQGEYQKAEQQFREVLRLQPNNQIVRKNIAICLLNQDRLDDAEKLLNQILDAVLDDKAAQLLKVIQETRLTGRSVELQIETTQSISASPVSELAEFFLDHCTYQGVRADRVREGVYDIKYAQADVQELERLALELKTARPRERASYYLSAAKITLLRDDNAPSDQFYKYLCRSFASTGDGYLSEGRHINTVQEMYCEALSVYDGDQGTEKHERDAANALVRYVASSLGTAYIPRTPSIPSLDEIIREVLDSHPQVDRAFDALGYLSLRSRYAMDRVLKSLYKHVKAKSTLQVHLFSYLEKRTGVQTGNFDTLDRLLEAWKDVRRKKLDEYRLIGNGLRVIGEFEVKTASMESCIEQLKTLIHYPFFDLDQERLRQLSRILNLVLDLCKQDTFDDQDRLCITIRLTSQELIDEIENNPTKISVEELMPLVNKIIKKINAWQERLYESSTPQLALRFPVDSFTPDTQEQIEIQVVVENRRGCSPAESLEIVVQEDRELFQVMRQDIKLDGSLRGGEQRILRIPLKVFKKAQTSETFSLPVYAHYITRSGDTDQTKVNSFPILLYSKDDFAEIHNPYAEYAEGGIVGRREMFYGRGELLVRVADTIKGAYSQSKCVVIYGQKRAGKSSILYHLKELLTTENILALDVGNIGSAIDENSSVSLLYQILWSILRKLRNAIEDRVEVGYEELKLELPRDVEFFAHPSPLTYFVDLFDEFRRLSSRSSNWRDLRPVVLIDEFSYVFDQINRGRLSPEFMKNWKAILQHNFFNAVLVGQDVMPKFKERFPNEFGTTQDEAVSYLRREDAIKLIEDPIRFGDGKESRYREKAIELILDLTAGSPFYIQIICNRLVQYMNRKRSRLVTDADVEQIKNELITGANSLGRDKFDNLINSGDTSQDAISDENILKVLAAIAVNSRTGPCRRSSIACETTVPIDTILEDLVRRRVLERERDSYYRITVGLFKEWLIVHQG